MTPTQAFFHFLYTLQHTTNQCENVKQSAYGLTHVVTYGGSCIQAFFNAIWSNGVQAFVWIDQAS